MAIPTQYQVIQPPVQNAMGGAHLHTPQSIFQHMMGQQNEQLSTGSWSHMPQVPPMMMPWSIPSLQQSQLVRFTGERLQSRDPSCGKLMHMKRKIEVPDVAETHCTKQFITEEKMAAHFQDMHISTNYSEASASSPFRINEPQPCCSTASDEPCIDLDLDSDSSNIENTKNMHPRLVISEELKRFHQEPMLPATLLSKLERPSMALVLWEPPSKHLRMLSNGRNILQFPIPSNDNNNNSNNNNSENSTMSNNSSANNNHEDILDMNQTIMEEQNNLELEPMDL